MMRYILTLILCLFSNIAVAQDLAGLARAADVDLDSKRDGTVSLTMRLTQPVPYSVTVLKEPDRIALRFNKVTFQQDDLAQIEAAAFVDSVQVTATTPDMTELSLMLNAPALVRQVQLLPSGRFGVVIEPTSAEAFASVAIIEDHVVTDPLTDPMTRNTGDRPWVIALDPGHGGVDPGADGGRKSEADLMLLFAFELRSALRNVGFDVVLTRDADVFVGLEERLTIARDARADAFLSLHADAVVIGLAEGVTIYTLSNAADAQADAKLAARHERHDILAGVDLEGQGDEVAQILLDMVRRDTRPRSAALADNLIAAAREIGTRVNNKPRRRGDFAVLRAADIPSVLIELGFLSSPRDLERLNLTSGRAQLITGIVNGLQVWAQSDAAAAALIRQ